MKMKMRKEEDEYVVETSHSMSSEETVSAPISSCQSPSCSDDSPSFKTDDGENMMNRRKKFGRKSNSFTYRIREHVKMGPKLSETVKGKLSLGARIIQNGGRENIFRQMFGLGGDEKLLKASQCYLSTTAGPIAGILFVSTLKVAFCSERSITVPSPTGAAREFVRTPYKVSIPVNKIEKAKETENMNKPTQKFIQIVTEDSFEFWFMGFVRYELALMNLQKAISMSSTSS